MSILLEASPFMRLIFCFGFLIGLIGAATGVIAFIVFIEVLNYAYGGNDQETNWD